MVQIELWLKLTLNGNVQYIGTYEVSEAEYDYLVHAPTGSYLKYNGQLYRTSTPIYNFTKRVTEIRGMIG